MSPKTSESAPRCVAATLRRADFSERALRQFGALQRKGHWSAQCRDRSEAGRRRRRQRPQIRNKKPHHSSDLGPRGHLGTPGGSPWAVGHGCAAQHSERTFGLFGLWLRALGLGRSSPQMQISLSVLCLRVRGAARRFPSTQRGPQTCRRRRHRPLSAAECRRFGARPQR